MSGMVVVHVKSLENRVAWLLMCRQRAKRQAEGGDGLPDKALLARYKGAASSTGNGACAEDAAAAGHVAQHLGQFCLLFAFKQLHELESRTISDASQDGAIRPSLMYTASTPKSTMTVKDMEHISPAELPESATVGSSSTPADSEKGQKTSDQVNEVGWDEPGDPENPMNWLTWLKVVNVGLISCPTFIIPLASSMLAPGVPHVMKEFSNNNDLLADFVVSVYGLGFAIGPMLLAPIPKLFSRLWIYHATNVGFIVFIDSSKAFSVPRRLRTVSA
ncbi:hypothetical protein O1611_g6946 [Lasiodiplodia mahajangana]|uniref:Uncharacterized protein n=1 Tax=Lasiodiplodia mahajangana TaxID=1108764 RepID=A0ACC2JH51_9PEZI|nr:hypothetical protein O1611_g6946 [Lasiodiplodia mahajangana]